MPLNKETKLTIKIYSLLRINKNKCSLTLTSALPVFNEAPIILFIIWSKDSSSLLLGQIWHKVILICQATNRDVWILQNMLDPISIPHLTWWEGPNLACLAQMSDVPLMCLVSIHNFKYVFTWALSCRQDVTQGQFLSSVQLVWIQGFLLQLLYLS